MQQEAYFAEVDMASRRGIVRDARRDILFKGKHPMHCTG